MSQQIIEVLDYLFEKFGIAIDWTSENVMPYIQELAGKIVTYNVVSNAIVVGVTALILVGCCIYARCLYGSYKLCNTTEKSTMLFDADYNWNDKFNGAEMNVAGATGLGCLIFCAVISTVIFFCSLGELLRWIFIPELQLVEYISNLINNVQV